MGAVGTEPPSRHNNGGGSNQPCRDLFISDGGCRSRCYGCTAATSGTGCRTVMLVSAGCGMRRCSPRKQAKRTHSKARPRIHWAGDKTGDAKKDGLQGDRVGRHHRANRAHFASQAHEQESTSPGSNDRKQRIGKVYIILRLDIPLRGCILTPCETAAPSWRTIRPSPRSLFTRRRCCSSGRGRACPSVHSPPRRAWHTNASITKASCLMICRVMNGTLKTDPSTTGTAC